MSIHLKIASDFVCPYCYVLEAMIEQLRPELDVENAGSATPASWNPSAVRPV